MRLALLILTVASAGSAGCWSTAQVAAPVVDPGVVLETSGSVTYRPPQRHGFPLHSVWEGTYVCAQGLSGVQFTIESLKNGEATAQYEFGPTPSNTAVPHGAYTMKGQLHGTAHGFTADFEPDEWIDHPPGYMMVSLTLVAEGREMTGTIGHPSCSQFQTHRAD